VSSAAVLMMLFYTLSHLTRGKRLHATTKRSFSDNGVCVDRDGGVMTATTGHENGFDREPCVTNASPGTGRAQRFESVPRRDFD